MKLKLIITVGIVGIVASGYGAFVIFLNQNSPASVELETAHQANIQVSLQEGQALYQTNCASCHGVALEGQANWRTPNAEGIYPAPPHDETGHTWHHNDNFLFEYIKLGGAGIGKKFGIENIKTAMPGYQETLTDAEIISIINYIKSTWSAEIRKNQPTN